jgi:hypothetical protein
MRIKKVTGRERFLAKIDAMVPRGHLMALIAPDFSMLGPKGGRMPRLFAGYYEGGRA